MNKPLLKIGLLVMPVVLSQLIMTGIFLSLNAVMPPLPPPIFEGTVTGYTSEYNLPPFIDHAILIVLFFISIKLWIKYIHCKKNE